MRLDRVIEPRSDLILVWTGTRQIWFDRIRQHSIIIGRFGSARALYHGVAETMPCLGQFESDFGGENLGFN
jgi:hypothetical protein